MKDKQLTPIEPQGIEEISIALNSKLKETEEECPADSEEDDKYQQENGNYYCPWRGSPAFMRMCEIPWQLGMKSPLPRALGGQHEMAVGMSLLTHSKQWNLMQMAKDCLEVKGEYWECGVYAGGSATIIGKVLAGSKKKLRLFDTFTGIAEKNHPLDHHNIGDMDYTDTSALKDLFSSEKDLKKVDVSLEVGIIPASFETHQQRQIAFVHIDLDQHDSVLECLKFVWPRMSEGGVVVFDDYGSPTCKGAREATDTYCESNSLNLLSGIAGQAYLFKKNPAMSQLF